MVSEARGQYAEAEAAYRRDERPHAAVKDSPNRMSAPSEQMMLAAVALYYGSRAIRPAGQASAKQGRCAPRVLGVLERQGEYGRWPLFMVGLAAS